MAQEKTFSFSVREEGPSKTIRGKIPSGVLTQIGAKDGDIVELTTTGKFITGGRVLRGRDAQAARESRYTQSRTVEKKKATPPEPKVKAPVRKSAPPAKTVAPKPVAKKPVAVPVKKIPASVAQAKPTKKPAKSNGRKTSVAYEVPVPKKPIGKKPVKAVPRARR